MQEKRYNIIRFYRDMDKQRKVVAKNVDEATKTAWVNDPKTSTETYFDGFEEIK